MLAGIEARKQGIARVDGPYHLLLQASRPDKRRRDIDNLIKPVSDLLVSIGVVRDDGDCELVSAQWVESDASGVTVKVSVAEIKS